MAKNAFRRRLTVQCRWFIFLFLNRILSGCRGSESEYTGIHGLTEDYIPGVSWNICCKHARLPPLNFQTPVGGATELQASHGEVGCKSTPTHVACLSNILMCDGHLICCLVIRLSWDISLNPVSKICSQPFPLCLFG